MKAADNLEGLLHALEARIDHLEQELATEVRTRRVVVVGPDGFERVLIEARETHGGIEVRANVAGAAEGCEPSVELLAIDEVEWSAPMASVVLRAQEQQAAMLKVEERDDLAMVDFDMADHVMRDEESVEMRSAHLSPLDFCHGGLHLAADTSNRVTR